MDFSNYWDDFRERVQETTVSLKNNVQVPLKRLTVHLTENCNFRCEYCNAQIKNCNIDLGLVYKIIDEYSEMHSGETPTIHFTGGEPSLYPHIETVCEYAKSKNLVVSMNTNAFKRINSDNIDKLKTSFDSPFSDKFDNMMGVRCFDNVVDNMKYYSDSMKNKMMSITAVLNKLTYKDMIELAKFVNKEFDVYNLYYSNYKGNDPRLAFTEYDIYDMFENYIPQTLKVFEDNNDKYSYKQLKLYKPLDFVDNDVRFEINKTLPCYIQLSEMTIDVNGNVHNCSHLYRDRVKTDIANISKYSLEECFKRLKKDYDFKCLSDKCLSGCNSNLIGFNKKVHENK